MKKFKIVIIALILILGLGIVYGWHKVKPFIGRRAELDVMKVVPSDLGYDYESFRVMNKENIEIAGWWIPSRGNRGTIIIEHGYNMNKSRMLSRAEVFLEAGFNVILIDLRARGESGGKITGPGFKEANDVLAAVEYFTKNYSNYRPLIVYGFSYGARAVIFATEKSSEIETVIAESPFISGRESFKRGFKTSWAPPVLDRDLLEWFRSYGDQPVLLLAGDRDPGLTIEEAKSLHEAASNRNSQLHIFPNTGHGVFTKENQTKFAEVVFGFLEKIFQSESEKSSG